MPEQLPRSVIESALQAAIQAPSSHNTQPWRFAIADDGVSLFADRDRALKVNDPDNRELTISCGAALLNLRLAMANIRFRCSIRLLPDPENADLLAQVVFSSALEPDWDDIGLSQLIPERRTYRKRFADSAVEASVVDTLGGAVTSEGATLNVLNDPALRRSVADLVAEGDRQQWADPGWRRELAEWMRRPQAGDGLVAAGLATAAARPVIRTFDMGNGVAAKDHELAEGSPVLALLSTPGNTPADWLAAGQALQRLLLCGCRAGLQASYLNQPVQLPSLRTRLQRAVGSDAAPQLLLRLGYPTEQVAATPRRPLSDVVVPASSLSLTRRR